MIGFEYSYDIDKYNTFSASLTGMPGVMLSAAYSITTKNDYKDSISTTLELAHIKNPNNNANKVPITLPIPESVYKEEISADYITNLGTAIGTSAIAFFALVETAISFGAGLWNDAPALAAAYNYWMKFIQTLSPAVSSSAQYVPA